MGNNNIVSIIKKTIYSPPFMGGVRGWVLFLFLFIAVALHAQVKFTASMQQTAPDEITISFSGTMAKGWHVYAPEEKHGPIAASFNVDKIEGAKVEGPLKANKPATKKFEAVWKGEVAFYEDNVTFSQKVKLTGKEYKIRNTRLKATLNLVPAMMRLAFPLQALTSVIAELSPSPSLPHLR